MKKSFRAAIAGVIIGLIGGMLYVEYGFMKKFLSIADKTDQNVSDDYLEETLSYYDLCNETELYGSEVELQLEESSQNIGDLQTEKVSQNSGTNQPKATDESSDVIRIKVSYEGDEDLDDDEKEQLEQYVTTAVLYGISEKLGEDYADLDISEVRSSLIMSLEYINSCAEESAEEWGVFVTAKSGFDYIYMAESNIGGEAYPAGYYETLYIQLAKA